MTMTLEELGELLRAEREKKGMLIEDVADRLKLSVRSLRALEEGDRASLPHAVYVRGFISAYGALLELDPEALLNVENIGNEGSISKSAFEPAITRTHGGKKKFFIFFLLCVCIALAVLIWLHRDNDLFSKLKEDHLTTAQPAPPLSAASNMSSITTAAGEVRQTDLKVSGYSEAHASQVPQAVTQSNGGTDSADQRIRETIATSSGTHITSPLALGAAVDPENDAVSTPAEVADVLPQDRQNASSASGVASVIPHKVIITAVDECWIHSNADKKDTRQFSLRKGDTFALTFDESLELKLGNAGGVRIHYDGKEMPVPGKDGEVKTIIFPPST